VKPSPTPASSGKFSLHWGYLAPFGVFLVLVGFLAVGLQLNPRDIGSTLINQPAPSFSLATLKEPQQMLTQELFQGQVSLVNVWASWCVSCRQEHPLLMEIAKRNMVALYGLNWKDTADAAQQWLSQHGDPYLTSLFDPSGRAGIDYGVTGTPETFLIDQHGIVRYKHTGPITLKVFEETLWPAIEALRKESST